MIFVIIPVFNRWHYTKECLLSLHAQECKDFKIVVVDHGSTDETSHRLKIEFPNVIVLKGNESMWWTAATNLGVKFSLKENCSHILCLNNDLTVNPNYLQTFNELIKINPHSLIGSSAVDKTNSENVIFKGIKWNKWTARYQSLAKMKRIPEAYEEPDFYYTDLLPGRGTLVTVSAFKEIGLFDEVNFPHYGSDEDFSLRCKKKGYSLLVSKKAIVHSVVEATGLTKIRNQGTLKYLNEIFSSIKSPLNLKRRWLWAKLHSPFPLMYFLFDFIRILISQIRS
jgi:GT2 family glycosyltransferase